MDDLRQFITKCDPKHARKKLCDKSKWKRVMEQRKRYVKSCKHLLFKMSRMVLCKIVY